MEINKEEIYKQGLELLILGLKILKPDISDDEAKNFIITIGNFIQLDRLKQDDKLWPK